jgi:hypothetical protein
VTIEVAGGLPPRQGAAGGSSPTVVNLRGAERSRVWARLGEDDTGGWFRPGFVPQHFFRLMYIVRLARGSRWRGFRVVLCRF